MTTIYRPFLYLAAIFTMFCGLDLDVAESPSDFDFSGWEDIDFPEIELNVDSVSVVGLGSSLFVHGRVAFGIRSVSITETTLIAEAFDSQNDLIGDAIAVPTPNTVGWFDVGIPIKVTHSDCTWIDVTMRSEFSSKRWSSKRINWSSIKEGQSFQLEFDPR